MKFINKILELLFPKICGICGKYGNYICEDCYQKLKEKEINYCKNNIFFIYKYEGIIRNLLIKYKFNDASYLYKTFTYCIMKNKKLCVFLEKYDIIIPVPLHKKRMLDRGYNQSELIAKEMQYISCVNPKEKKSIIMMKDILVKNKNIKPQSTKCMKDRIQDVQGIYSIYNFEKIYNKNVLIFDDIYTTGSTCNECKKVLEEAGAKTVGILTLARD